MKDYLMKNKNVKNQPKLIKYYLVNEYLSRSELRKSM